MQHGCAGAYRAKKVPRSHAAGALTQAKKDGAGKFRDAAAGSAQIRQTGLLPGCAAAHLSEDKKRNLFVGMAATASHAEGHAEGLDEKRAKPELECHYIPPTGRIPQVLI